MISFKQLQEHFPNTPKNKLFVQHMVKEYLQIIILGKLYKTATAPDIIFIGGTSLRFCYGLDRFSEDLDFDYMGNDREDLREIFDNITKQLKQDGLKCSIEHNYKDTDNYCKIYFSGLSDYFPLTDIRKKIWIKIDIQKNYTPYNLARHFVNRFGLYYPVNLPEIDILFSMKTLALTQRVKARDMYDFSFLQPNSKLNLNYIRCELLRKGMKINTTEDVKKLILSKEKNTDMNEKIHEISLFITNKENVSRVEYFFDFLRDLNFDL